MPNIKLVNEPTIKEMDQGLDSDEQIEQIYWGNIITAVVVKTWVTGKWQGVQMASK